MKWRIPFVSRHEFDLLKIENMTLRDALRNANAELLKHRRLIADIRDGDGNAFDRIRKVKA
jgi:hypothetical protein